MKPNLKHVKTIAVAKCLLADVKLTRSLIIGKFSEFFNP